MNMRKQNEGIIFIIINWLHSNTKYINKDVFTCIVYEKETEEREREKFIFQSSNIFHINYSL